MLSDEQLREFAEQGYVVIRGAVPADLVAAASQRIDEIVAADPPGGDVRGNHFYWLKASEEPALIAPLAEESVFARAEALVAPGKLDVPWQVQLALNIPPHSHRPGRPHIDAGIAEPTPGHTPTTFTLLAGILMSDQLAENSGNLWIWPGTHLTHAAYFREHGTAAYCAYPDIDLPEPVQLVGKAGDLLLAHYLLGHNIGGNYASEQTRRALYYRISVPGHFDQQDEFLQDVWLEYPAVRSRPASPPPVPGAA